MSAIDDEFAAFLLLGDEDDAGTVTAYVKPKSEPAPTPPEPSAPAGHLDLVLNECVDLLIRRVIAAKYPPTDEESGWLCSWTGLTVVALTAHHWTDAFAEKSVCGRQMRSRPMRLPEIGTFAAQARCGICERILAKRAEVPPK